MSQAPSMPMFVDAMLADTMHLTTEEFGAYHFILYATWRKNGDPLEDDAAMLARICRVSPAVWRKLRPILVRFFDVSDGTWRQKRLEREWAYVAERAERAKANGKRGGRPKATEEEPKKNPVGSVRDTQEQSTQPQPQSHKLTHVSKTRAQILEPEEKNRRFDLVRSAMNIHPDDTSWGGIKPWLEMWEVRGAEFEADVLATMLSVMSKKLPTFTPNAMNYFDDAVQKNFDARVRRGELPAPESTLPAAPINQDESRWSARLAGYRRGNPWDADRNGPAPGEPGCKVPAHLLIEAASSAA